MQANGDGGPSADGSLSASSGDAAGWVDALPYIDMQYAERGMKDRVDALIRDEMAAMQSGPKKDYLGHLPVPVLRFAGSTFLETELARVAAGTPMASMDKTRYKLDRPSGSGTDPTKLKAWAEAVANAKAQLEHQHLRLMNLELMQKYGANAWLEQNKAFRQIKDRLEAQAKLTREAVVAANKKRKASQTALGPELHRLDRDFADICAKNLAVRMACEDLETQLKRARKEGKAGNASGKMDV